MAGLLASLAGAGLATAAGNVPIASSFEIAAKVTGLMEQAFVPSLGKAGVDSMVDVRCARVFEGANIPLPVVVEILERQIKPRLQWLRYEIDSQLGMQR